MQQQSAPADGRTEVEVQILGPVGVVGAARPFRRPWALELIVYLALHPEGATADRWATALWPDRLVADPTRHSTVSAARRALGRASAGGDHLPHGRGRLRLGPAVSTDWRRFQGLASTGDPGAWVAALGLVRGRPFDGLRTADWTVLEGVAAEVEDAVVQVARAVVRDRLAAGDGHGAERAARRGLLAAPYDERLYRDLLRAADLQGNPAGVEAAMAELVGLLGGGPPVPGTVLPTPGGKGVPRPGRPAVTADLARWVHPRTAALYDLLSRRHDADALAGRR